MLIWTIPQFKAFIASFARTLVLVSASLSGNRLQGIRSFNNGKVGFGQSKTRNGAGCESHGPVVNERQIAEALTSIAGSVGKTEHGPLQASESIELRGVDLE